jgi:hypothetical protein
MSETNTAVALSPSAILSMAPGANLGAYVQTVSAIQILSVDREKELAERLFYDNCVDSARELGTCTPTICRSCGSFIFWLRPARSLTLFKKVTLA